MKRFLTGIKPTGYAHIGNYFGAIKPAIELSREKEYEGFSKAVRMVMQEASRGTLKNIHGPVSKLLKTADEYTVAIETALGAAMQHIVVSSEEDGKAAAQQQIVRGRRGEFAVDLAQQQHTGTDRAGHHAEHGKEAFIIIVGVKPLADPEQIIEGEKAAGQRHQSKGQP